MRRRWRWYVGWGGTVSDQLRAPAGAGDGGGAGRAGVGGGGDGAGRWMVDGERRGLTICQLGAEISRCFVALGGALDFHRFSKYEAQGHCMLYCKACNVRLRHPHAPQKGTISGKVHYRDLRGRDWKMKA